VNKRLAQLGRRPWLVALIVGVIAAGLAGIVSAHGGDSTLVHGCVNLSTGSGGARGQVTVYSLPGMTGPGSGLAGPFSVCGTAGLALDWDGTIGGGAPGPTGPAGGPGPVGVTGPIGEIGPAGPTGGGGPAGPTGRGGATGPAGSTGPAGATGPVGSTGPIGATGLAGATGPAGTTGPSGAIGPSGASGPVGADGPSGSLGPSGATGPSGPAGPSGATGGIGPGGASGPSGPTGPSGPSSTMIGGALSVGTTFGAGGVSGTQYGGLFDAMAYSSETDARSTVAVAGTVSNLRVRFNAPPGTGQSFAVAVRKNESSVGAISCTVSDTGVTCSNTSSTLTFVAGDRISVKVDWTPGAAAATAMHWSMQLTPS
jgi:hypothetical protein